MNKVDSSYGKAGFHHAYTMHSKKIAQQQAKHKKENDDILAKAPFRLLAYSNEVGAAISPINKTLGTVLWAPALLYLGADIYDKYKNEDKIYNPSAKRSVRQAIFQGFSSVLLPTAAIKIGQKIGVNLTKGKGSLSATDKKELVEYTLSRFENKRDLSTVQSGKTFSEELISDFKADVSNNKTSLESKGFLSHVFSFFKESEGCEKTMTKHLKAKSDNNPVMEYLKDKGKIVDEILESSDNIRGPKYIKLHSKLLKKSARNCYENLAKGENKNQLKNMSQDGFANLVNGFAKNADFTPDKNVSDVVAQAAKQASRLAKKDTLLKILKDSTVEKSVVATISGFVALAIMIKPIDYFVENVLIEKVVDPAFEKIPKTIDNVKQKVPFLNHKNNSSSK